MLAAVGIDEVERFRARPRGAAAIAALGSATVAVAGLGALVLVSGIHKGFPNRSLAFGVLWGLALVAGVAIAVLLPARSSRVLAISAVVVLDAIVMFVLPELSAPGNVETDRAPVSYLQGHLGLSRFASLGPFRADYGAYFGTASINNVDLPIPSNWAVHVRTDLDPFAKPEQFAGDRSTAPSSEQELVSHLDHYRADGVSYVLTFPGDGLPQSPSTFTRVLATPSAWIYRVAGAAPYFSTEAAGCTAALQTRTAVKVSCSQPTVLVRRETYLSGWSAQVDGHSTPIDEVDGLFQSVPLPAGSHEVTFSYAPPGIGLAYAAFALGLVWLISWPRWPGRTAAATRLRRRASDRSSRGSPAA